MCRPCGRLTRAFTFLTWVEEWQAVGTALLLDYQALRNVGVLYGLDDSGHVHTLCGARLKLLSEMK